MGKRNTFKYEEYLQKVREIHKIECPFEDAQNLSLEAFRWVDKPMIEENFISASALDELNVEIISQL